MRPFLTVFSSCFLVACSIGCMQGKKDEATTPGSKQEAKATKQYTREELEKLLIGKHQDEVLALLGRPAETTPWTYDSTWRYEKLTFDTISQKVDSNTFVEINNETKKVTKIRY